MSISFQSMLNLSSNHVLRDTILTHIESQFLLHLTNVFFLFSGCSSIPIHPLGCLELEAFFLFEGWTPPPHLSLSLFCAN